MPTINASKYGILGNSSVNSFSQCRNSSNANDFTSNQPTSSNAISVRMRYVSGGKGSEWQLYRAFFAFDVTSYQTGYTISNLRLDTLFFTLYYFLYKTLNINSLA